MRPEFLYMGALGCTGAASLVTVALAPAQRGELASIIAGATMGSAIGGFSIDTFLLSRPAGWVVRRGRTWIAGLLAAGIGLSMLAAVVLITIAGVGDFRGAAIAAAALTVFNAAASLLLRRKKFILVYASRAAGGALLIAGYGGLYLSGRVRGELWSTVWVLVQIATALALGGYAWAQARRLGFGGPDPRPAAAPKAEYRADVVALGKLHLGISAQMMTYRLDQVLLARFAGAGPLGVYALAVAALEFAQAGAVVAAQRILVARDRSTQAKAGPVVKAALPVAVLAVAGLAVAGWLVPGYHDAWLYGVALLPGAVAVAVGKTWSAQLLKQRGEQATTVVAVITLVAAVPMYLVLIPWLGALGAALASTGAYAVYATQNRLSLRRTPARLLEQAV